MSAGYRVEQPARVRHPPESLSCALQGGQKHAQKVTMRPLGVLAAARKVALQPQCAAHSILDQVTVLKAADGTCGMSTLRAQLDAIRARQEELDLIHVHHQTEAFTARLLDVFETAAHTSGKPLGGDSLLYYPFGGVDVVSALAHPAAAIVLASAEVLP